MIEKENLVELAKRYNITGFATAIKVVESLSQENIRLSEQLAFQNKELFAGIAKASSDGIKIQKLESEVKALKQENIRLKGQLKIYQAGETLGETIYSTRNKRISELESENKKLSEGLTIAYMSGVADGKEGSRVLESENKKLREEREGVINKIEEFKSGWSTGGNTKYIVDGMNIAITILRNNIEFKDPKHTCVQTGMPCGFPCWDKCPVHKDLKNGN